MPQEQGGIRKISGIGVIAAFGLLTMSSRMTNSSSTTGTTDAYCYESHNYINNENTVSNSSLLSKQAVGDIVSLEKSVEFVQQHKTVNTKLQIVKITKHVSNFDFDEEYEEI